MNKLKVERHFSPSPEVVLEIMLNPESYKTWTAAFNPTSYYEGELKKGELIRFLGVDPETGKKGGMVASIEEYLPNKQVSFKHLGIVNDGEDVLEGEAVEGWAGSMEEYFFVEDENGGTTLTVLTDTNDEYNDYFNETWPKALDILEELVNKR